MAKKKVKSERSRLIIKLDAAFSKFIRTRWINEDGCDVCFTCGDYRHWSEVDAGHFQSRRWFPTRWDEKNVQFQCKKCNGFYHGQQYLFGKNLDAFYGAGTADALIRKSKIKHKFNVNELRELLKKYERKK